MIKQNYQHYGIQYYGIKRASRWGALFVWLLLAWSLLCVVGDAVAEQRCAVDHVDETAVVARVIDGDTLYLQDGRSVRLIGINSPELGYDDKPAEPLAEQARDALKALIKPNSKVGLRYGHEQHDRYQRLLAHVYLADGKSVEAYMLTAGLAAQIVVPPNVDQLDCYHAAEQTARNAGKGVWAGIYRPVPVVELSRKFRGFKIITGRISRVGKSKNSLWLNFPGPASEGSREIMAVRIARKDLPAFTEWQPQSLQGKTIIVRGWVYQHKRQQVIRVRHPASIEILQ